MRSLNLLLGAASALAFPAAGAATLSGHMDPSAFVLSALVACGTFGIATRALQNEGSRSKAVPPERKVMVKPMKQSRVVFLGTAMVAIAIAAVACGDDDVATTPRPDGGTPDATVADTGGGNDATPDGTSACGLINLPTDYVSAAYETNAKTELDLRTAFAAFLKPMSDNEAAVASGDAGVAISKSSLDALWITGTPNVKSITTTYWANRVDGWLTAYQTASNQGSMDTAMATVVTSGQTSPANGGFYGRYAYDGSLIDLRQAIEKGTYTAGFFNHAANLVTAGNLTEASIDRLLAAWGAHPSFQNSHVANDAGTTSANRDIQSAGYAARRTKKDGSPGPYTRAKAALIKAKAAIAAGAQCNAERDQAIKEFFLEWEKGTYATVVFYFSDIVTKLANPPLTNDATGWTNLFHAHGECIGFLGGFKSTPQAHRKITDVQIDGLLTKALLPEGGASKIVELKTNTAASVISLNGVLADIKTIYGFTDEEMTSFKVVYTK